MPGWRRQNFPTADNLLLAIFPSYILDQEIVTVSLASLPMIGAAAFITYDL